MSKTSTNVHEYKGIQGTIKIFRGKSTYSGSWLCKTCRESNSAIGISNSLSATDTTTKLAFESHIDGCHQGQPAN
jgi:hypothetical protein